MIEKKYEYFWETEYPFQKMLEKIFPTYKTKYSLTGNGIFNLVFINDKIYEVKYTRTTSMGENDNHSIDMDKKFIIDTIVDNLKTDNIAVFGGKFITFPVANWIAKVEIIKKLKMPS